MSTAVAAPAGSDIARRHSALGTRHPALRLWIALGVVLAVAAFTRWWQLDLIDFKADEAQIARLAVEVAQGHWPATSIQTSGGIFNPPLPVYFFGIAALFTRDPAWQAAVIGLLDVLAVAAVFVIGRRYFCGRVGLAGAAFYAANAYATIFARKLAGPFLQPLFAALLLACLLGNSEFRIQNSESSPRRHGRPWTWGAAVFLLAVLVQFHLGALLLAPVIAVLFLLSRPSWRAAGFAAAGVLLGAALCAPYLVYEFSNQAGNFVPSLLGAAGGTPGWGFGAFRLIWVTITSPGYGDLTGTPSALFNAESWPAGFVTPLAGAAVLGGLGVALWRWRDRRYLTLIVFVLLPLLLMLRHTSDARIHYFVFLEPAIFLLAGIGFDALLMRWRQLITPAFALLALLLVVQTANLVHFTSFIQQHELPADGYGLPLAYQERLFGHVVAMDPGAFVIGAVRSRDEAYPAGYLLRYRGSGLVDANEGVWLPPNGLIVVMSQASPVARLLATALSPAYKEPLPGGREFASVYAVGPDAPQAIERTQDMRTSNASWSNGLALTGFAASRSLPGQLAALWRVRGPLPSGVTFFSHVLDDGGKQWFGHDGAPVPVMYQLPMPAGTTLVTVLEASLPPDAPLQEYWWTVGLYEDGGRRVPLASGDSELRLARLKGGSSKPSNVTFQAADATFDSAIQLTGYAIDAGGVTLRWSSLREVPADYTVFVHAVDSSGKLAGQADGQPSNGHYPTSLWDPGETVVDAHTLTVPPGAHVEVGLYDLGSGERLKLPDGTDHVTLPLT